MTVYQYKTVAAPRRVKKVKGVKGPDALIAHNVGELIAAEASQGWEYQRTDRFPVEEKGGMFSKPVLNERAVLIFRKAVTAARPQVQPQPVAQPAQPAIQPVQQPQAAPVQSQPAPQPVQPQPVAAAQQQRTEPGFSIAGVEPSKAPPIGGAQD